MARFSERVLFAAVAMVMGASFITSADERRQVSKGPVSTSHREWYMTVTLYSGTAQERRDWGRYELHVADKGKVEIRKVKSGPPSRYDVLYSREPTGDERSAMFRAARDELNSFSLSAKQQVFSDGWTVSTSLRSGSRRVEVTVEDLDNPKDAGPAASMIVDFINAHVRADDRISIAPD